MFPTYEEAFNPSNIPYDELEKLKQAGKKEKRKKLIIFAIVVVVSIILFFVGLTVVGFIATVIAGIYAFSTSKGEAAYVELFKRQVIGPLAHNIITQAKIADLSDRQQQYVRYEPNVCINHKTITSSQLFNNGYDDKYGQDYFEGQLGLTEFEFSELHLTKTHESTDSDGNTTTTTETIFDGLLFVADFKKDFNGFTILETRALKNRKGVGKIIGNIITGLSSKTSLANATKISLENEEFNQTFRIRTTDEIEARYILSSKMIEKLLNFKDSHSYGMAISFCKSNMYIAISSPRDFFDEGITKVNGQYNVESVYNDLVFLFSIIEDFELNNRIWSKT